MSVLKTLMIMTLVSVAHFAHARSLNPCTPSRELMPTNISCQLSDDGGYASIVIRIWASPSLPQCHGENYFESKEALVELSGADGKVTKNLRISDGDFSYTLSPGGDATFTSEKEGLTLKRCVTPVPGGVSFGN